MGKGKRLQTKIVLADTLPQLHNEIAPFELAVETGTCSRTSAMINEYIESEGRIYRGGSTEIIQATISGQIQSVEEFKLARKTQEELLQRLRDAVVLARSEKNDAEYQLSGAELAAREANAQAQTAQSRASQAEVQAGLYTATEADKTSAVLRRHEATAARENATRAEAIVQSKRDRVILANQRLQEATTALTSAESGKAWSNSKPETTDVPGGLSAPRSFSDLRPLKY